MGFWTAEAYEEIVNWSSINTGITVEPSKAEYISIFYKPFQASNKNPYLRLCK